MPRSLSPRLLAAVFAIALLGGCVTTQKVPVSTDPSGALVYLDGQQICAATPCSVEMATGQNHLLTIIKEGYGQKDIPVRPVAASGGGSALSPEIVTVRLYKPDEVDVRDTGKVVDTAVGMGIGVLKRVLEDAAKNAEKNQDLAPEK
ncbi:MAG: PEGA domain-containing protein [Humidesulfovibrio sp.]|uniref:PEGA domain-containing protein n=1 Tax=Humidesulfovibrio sp. TaxID=2910988 RepID=UPI0027F475C5|nr:PEGA domain-containing protein [Humidesulfovibrio sp.]MDQ7835405.1 PEGA domain-containing protein [Humidesulfovibrio sp.]